MQKHRSRGETHCLCPIEGKHEVMQRVGQERRRLHRIDRIVEETVANRQQQVEVGWTEVPKGDVLDHERPH